MQNKLLVLILIISLTSCSPSQNIHNSNSNQYLKMPTSFSNNMVLQRDTMVKFFGLSKPNTQIEVSIQNKKVSTTSIEDGRWLLELGPLKAGGPYKLKVKSADEQIIINKVYVGEVWFAAGQSNMVWSVEKSTTSAMNILNADRYQDIKFFMLESPPANQPKLKIKTKGWQNSNHINVREFSAVAYAFATRLYDDKKVPIGIIQAAWDNTKIEHWTSKDVLKGFKEFKDVISNYQPPTILWLRHYFELPDKFLNTGDPVYLKINDHNYQDSTKWVNMFKIFELQKQQYTIERHALKAHNRLEVRLKTVNKEVENIKKYLLSMNSSSLQYGDNEPQTLDNWLIAKMLEPEYPAVLFNGLVNPIIPYTLRGILWYQGESNIGKPELYKQLFPAMVHDWRLRWGQEELPILSVQLTPFNQSIKGKQYLFREVQEKLTKIVPNHYMATSIDLNDEDYDVHPKDKEDVGRRLFLLAQNKVYKQDIGYSGPTYDKMKIEGSKIRISFNNTADGLLSLYLSGVLTGFEIASNNRQFVKAQAIIDGHTILASSPQVSKPVAVRYAWSNRPPISLYNTLKLPALPFRTDDWQ